ncbi:MAG: hypothetical protein CMI79_01835 [Candidatus Pelagibacter sp.]|nr:hypothetical protein [Candidatus Pelagibacter sp.]
MDYDREYKPLINFILEKLSGGNFPEYSKKDISLMTKLYNEISIGFVTARAIKSKGDMLKTIVSGSQMTIPSPSRFLSKTVRQDIIDNQVKQYVYKYKLGYRNIKIVFGLLKSSMISDEELDHGAEKICSWLAVCAKYAKARCGQKQDVYIYMGNHKKRFPKSTVINIGPNNVNSGFSTICQNANEIIIYRQEEWFKVFLHETFHSFGFEPNEASERTLSDYLKEMLPIEPRVRVSEAYVETWARIINSSYASIIKSSDLNEYIALVRFSLLVESLFAVIQASRILTFMNLSYSDVIDKTSITAKTMYKENTNVFAYYLLTAAFIIKPYLFLKWCSNYNSNWLEFNNSPYAINNFKDFVNKSLQNRDLIKIYNKTANIENTQTIGLRMSIVDVN